MSDSLMGELLCLVLLLLVNGRIFFSSHKDSITIAALSPVCLVVSVFMILAQGCTVPAVLIFVLSFFTFILNIHAFSRFVSHLYVDRYRLAFYIFSLIILIFSFCLTVFFVQYREVPVNIKKYGVSETKEVFEQGKEIVWTFAPVKQSESGGFKKPVILFSADKRGDTLRYRPYLILLARAGYTVYAMDSYSAKYFSSWLDMPFFRRSAFIFASLRKPAVFQSMKPVITQNILKEFDDLFSIACERETSETSYFWVGDVMQQDAFQILLQKSGSSVLGSVILSSIDLYTAKGYGCITQTAPVLARLMGLEREKTLLIPSYMAGCTCNAITAAASAATEK